MKAEIIFKEQEVQGGTVRVVLVKKDFDNLIKGLTKLEDKETKLLNGGWTKDEIAKMKSEGWF